MSTFYVDFSATYNGDGTSAAQAVSNGGVGAFNTIVSVIFYSGDVVWFRRCDTAEWVLSASYAPTHQNVKFYGWPIVGDMHYAGRPQSAIDAGWDEDILQDYVNVRSANTAHLWKPSGTVNTLYRFKIYSNINGSAYTTELVKYSGDYPDIRYCYFGFPEAVKNTLINLRVLYTTGKKPTIRDVITAGSMSQYGPGVSMVQIESAEGGFIDNLSATTFASSGDGSGVQSLVYLKNTSTTQGFTVDRLNLIFANSQSSQQGTALILKQGKIDVLNGNLYCDISASYTGPGIYIDAVSDNCRVNVTCNGNIGKIVNLGASNTITLNNWKSYVTWTANANYLQPAPACMPFYLAVGKLGNTLILNDATVTLSPGIKPIWADSSCLVLLNYTNLPSDCFFTNNTQPDFKVYHTNYGKSIGLWHFENQYGKLDLSSVHRAGGLPYSIAATFKGGLSNTIRYALPISEEGRETIFLPIQMGSNTLTLYGAYKNFSTPPTRADIVFQVKYVNTSGALVLASTASSLALEADTGLWDDVGTTPFKIELDITDAEQQRVAVNIFIFANYNVSSIIYIDPKIVIS